MTYGRWVENEHSKTGKNGKRLYKLENIIERGRKHNQGSVEQLLAMMGTGE